MTGFFVDHLNQDSIVAYVDGELSLTAFQRAAAHVSSCPVCAAEVNEQTFARDSLRSAATPSMPGSLAAALFSIPVAMPTVARTPGVGVDSVSGHAIRISHVGREATRSRRFRFGAGALVAGLAVGAFATAGASGDSDPLSPPANPTGNPASYAPEAPAVGDRPVVRLQTDVSAATPTR